MGMGEDSYIQINKTIYCAWWCSEAYRKIYSQEIGVADFRSNEALNRGSGMTSLKKNDISAKI